MASYRPLRLLPLLAGCLALLALPALGDDGGPEKPGKYDWPQWRGPDRTGVSEETGLLKEWPKDGPPLAWKAKGLGSGYGSPAVFAGRVYLIGARDGSEYVFALDWEKDSAKVWERKFGAMAKVDYDGARSTPTVDGDRLYALSSDGDLACLKVEDGDVVWRKNLRKDFGGKHGKWGFAESPLVDGDRVIVTPGSRTASMVALDKKTGKTVWKAEVPQAKGSSRGLYAGGYASAIVGSVGGVKQYIQFFADGVVGVAAKDGKVLWSYGGTATDRANIDTPILHNGYVFTAVGYGKGGALVQLKPDGGKFDASQVYFSKAMVNHHGGVVRVGDALYGTTNTALLCLDFKTGDKKWQNRSVGKGSIAAADGMLYVRGEKGPIALVEATTAGYKERGRFTPPDRSSKLAWPHPVIAHGKLYLRDQGVLLCYDVKKK